MLMLILGAAVAAMLFYYLFVKPMDYWKERGVKQRDSVKLFFGDNFKNFLRQECFADTITDCYNYAPGTRYFGAYQLVKPILIVKDPQLIKQITVKDFDHFTDHRPFVPAGADPLWGKNLLALNGDSWRDMRSVLSPSFTSSKMRTMFVLMEECAESFVQNFLKKSEEIVTVEMKGVFTRFANDVIATTAFGVKVDSLAQPNNEFYILGKEATDLTGLSNFLKLSGFLMFPKLCEFFQVKLFSNAVSTFFRQLIDDTIRNREEKAIVRPDMIHLLMEARKGIHKHEETGIIDTGFATAQESDLGKAKTVIDLSNEDITAQALIFFFAGFESVSTLMSFTAYELAINQDVQDRLRKEIQDTLKECGGKLTYESLLKMKYMDMVISETLRLWPSGVITDRICTKPYTIEPATPGEKTVYLEKGALLSIPIFPIHRNAEYYPNPERFDPERFSDENKENIKPYTYMPFGAGPRICIGSRFALLEAKTIFFYMLQHFEIVPVEKTQIPFELSKKSFPLAAANGFWLGLRRIKNISNF